MADLWRDRLRKLREAYGLSQKELARRAGVSQGILSQYETGKKSFTQDTLDLILKALNADYTHIFSPDSGMVDFKLKIYQLKCDAVASILKDSKPSSIPERRKAVKKIQKLLVS